MAAILSCQQSHCQEDAQNLLSTKMHFCCVLIRPALLATDSPRRWLISQLSPVLFGRSRRVRTPTPAALAVTA